MNYPTVRAVNIDFWEYAALFVFLLIIGVVYAREKNIKLRNNPEYKYYLWGIYAKIIGGFLVSLIYIYYYSNGDTISFFKSALALANLAREDPAKYLEAIFAPNTLKNYYYYFNHSTGYPLGYIYMDGRTYMLVRIISPLTLLSFNSILITGAWVSTITYGGVWNMYRMLVYYYPRLPGRLAIAVLFLPSCVFWGSGILKDTFTFSAVCWFVYGVDGVFLRRRNVFNNWMSIVVAAWLMIAMKPYIFMTIFPACLLWILYDRVQRFRNAIIRVLFLPTAMLVLFMGSLFVLQSLGDSLGKFSLDTALQTILVNQADLKRSEQYGMNYFDLGEMDATWSSVLSKFPKATFAGLFRPQLNECNNVVMVLAGLENTFLLFLFMYILIRSRVVHFFTLILRNPLLQMCFVFAVGYAFMVGVTTPNFGAMVRFKIPMLPLFVSGLFITSHILDRRLVVLAKSGRFDFDSFSSGDPDRFEKDRVDQKGKRNIPRR